MKNKTSKITLPSRNKLNFKSDLTVKMFNDANIQTSRSDENSTISGYSIKGQKIFTSTKMKEKSS